MQSQPPIEIQNAPLTRRQMLRAAGVAAAALSVGARHVFGAAAPVKIGTLLSLTGALESYGKPIQNGAILAAQQINAAGGPMGRTLELTHRDSQTDPTAAIDAAKKLVEVDGVMAIVGALSSGVTIPVATSVTIPGRVLQISPASTSPQITGLNDDGFLFRTCPSDALQGKVSGRLAKELGYKKVAVVYVNNPYGKGLSDNFAQAFAAQGGAVTATVGYEKGKQSYRGEIQKAMRGHPDALAVFGYPENGVTVIRQALELGFGGKFLLADGMKAPEVVENVGTRYLAGTYGTAPGSKESRSKERFLDAYEQKFGEKPPKPFIDNCYDAVAVIALAMHLAQSDQPWAVRDAIRLVANGPGTPIEPGQFAKAFKLLDQGQPINYRGASGEIDFDYRGDVVSPIEVWKIDEDGRIVTERIEGG